MKIQKILTLVSTITAAFLSTSLQAKEARVLFFGIDGLRADAFANAKKPAMSELVADGVLIPKAQALHDYKGADTVSGPAWSSALTGVWANKHGVHRNTFEGRNFEAFPHFFKRVKQAHPQMQTVSLVAWRPLETFLVSDADIREYVPRPPLSNANRAAGKEISVEDQISREAARDELLAERAVKILKENDPSVMFVYFHQVDLVGHKIGFSPDIPEYMQSIEDVDKNIEMVLKALRARPQFQDENWLIVVASDHGGEGTSHGRGHNNPAMLDVPMVFSGPSTKAGTVIESPVYIVDIVPTILTHLGIAIDPAWELDGQVLELNTTAQP